MKIKISKNSVLSLCVLILLFLQSAQAQKSCDNCKVDSLTTAIKKAQTDDQKLILFHLLVDLAIEDAFGRYITRDSLLSYLKSLNEIGKRKQLNNIEAYENLQKGFEFMNQNNFEDAEQALKKSIDLFDEKHQKILLPLWVMRDIYNNLGKQEERFNFFKDRAEKYSINGPIENEGICYHGLGGYYLYKADYNLAISFFLKCISINKTYDLKHHIVDLQEVADAYAFWGNYEKANEYFTKTIQLIKISADYRGTLTYLFMHRSRMSREMNDNSKALLYADTSFIFNNNRDPVMTSLIHLEKAFSFIQLNNLNESLYFLTAAKKISDSIHLRLAGYFGRFELDYAFFQYYNALKKYNEAEKHLLTSYKKAVEEKENLLKLKYLRALSLFYAERNNSQLAFEYTKKFHDLTDEQNKEQGVFKIAQYENEEKEMQQKESINALKQESAVQTATIKKNKIILWGSLIALLVISISLFFVYRHYQMNKKTLSSLRKTQRQLILAEKMASLGELTAGIAHEIQNPLNFVNNFSEVNTELIDELTVEVDKGNLDEVKIIAKDIKENEQKINHHGKRADAIVKGMLQHSRSSSGVKESTDINALCDEYLRLSYHGLRAKDKSFNATMKTDFDKSIGNINIIPQDIGRVVLNLLTNAFYVVDEKKKQQLEGYEPTVTIKTLKNPPSGGRGAGIEISVTDNGNGIPQKIVDKIFQPFFTTKPTGQGTGLGLSLSYDIVKAHGGEIKVNTKENEGTEFSIILPL